MFSWVIRAYFQWIEETNVHGQSTEIWQQGIEAERAMQRKEEMYTAMQKGSWE